MHNAIEAAINAHTIKNELAIQKTTFELTDKDREKAWLMFVRAIYGANQRGQDGCRSHYTVREGNLEAYADTGYSSKLRLKLTKIIADTITNI